MDREIKNILILCDVFPPAFAPRMGYLCKYLPDYKWNPIVITEYFPQNIYQNLVPPNDVTYINYYWKGNKPNRLKYAFVFLTNLFFDYKTWVVKKKARVQIKKNNISLILACSSCRTFTIAAASQLSRQYKIPFVADLRDIVEQFPQNEHISKSILGLKMVNDFISSIVSKKIIRQRNKSLQNAEVVTSVSPWHVETLSAYNKNVKLIYNGFDADLFIPKTVVNKQFVITYAGRIESQALKDPGLLFEAVRYLHEEKRIDPKRFRIYFYLVDKISEKIVCTLAEKYSISLYVECFKNIQNTEIPEILNNSSILLLLANKSSEIGTPRGIMGTKTFEYLAMQKPVLCVRNDEACIEEMINDAKAGFSANTMEEVVCFIQEKQAEWEQTGYTHQSVNKDFVQQFSRRNQTERFVEIFNSLIEQ